MNKYEPHVYTKGEKIPETIEVKTPSDDHKFSEYFVYGKADLIDVLNPDQVEAEKKAGKSWAYVILMGLLPQEFSYMIFKLCYQYGDQMVEMIENGLLIYKKAKEKNFKI